MKPLCYCLSYSFRTISVVAVVFYYLCHLIGLSHPGKTAMLQLIIVLICQSEG